MQIELCDADQGFVLKNREGVIRVSFAMLEYVEVINKVAVEFMPFVCCVAYLVFVLHISETERARSQLAFPFL